MGEMSEVKVRRGAGGPRQVSFVSEERQSRKGWRNPNTLAGRMRVIGLHSSSNAALILPSAYVSSEINSKENRANVA